MNACAVVGMLVFSVAGLSFGQDPSDWGTRSLPQDRSNMGSPFGRALSPESGRISGTIVGVDGKPQQDVQVQIHDFASRRLLASSYTNRAGAFNFDLVPYGTYEIIANRGIATVREEVEVRDSFSMMNLRLNTSDPNAAPSQNGLVSLAEMRVPQRARDAYLKAEEAMVKHQPENVSKHLQKALELYPSYAPALTMRGLLSLGRDDLKAAVDDFDKAIHADSTYAMAHAGMAAALNRLNKFDDALRAAERASSLSPNAWQPYLKWLSHISQRRIISALCSSSHMHSRSLGRNMLRYICCEPVLFYRYRIIRMLRPN